MSIFLLICMYFGFIAIGLYSALFGVVWPVMHIDLGVDITYAPILPLVTTMGMFFGGILNEKIVKKLSVSKTAILGLSLSAFLMFALALSPSFWILVAISFPVGFGIGSLDVVINRYIPVYYQPKFASWGHCCWGIGALISPLIASFFLKSNQWRGAYITVGIIHLIIVALFIAAKPQWDKPREPLNKIAKSDISDKTKKKLTHIPGLIPVIISAFVYVGYESTTNYWGSSFMVNNRMISPEKAASFMAIFFGAMMISRFITGFLTMKFTYKQISWVAIIFVFTGIILMIIPVNSAIIMALSMGILGLGSGPIFTGMLSQTSERFGHHLAPTIISMQMSASFLGNAILPIIIGVVSSKNDISLLPIVLLAYIVLTFILTIHINRKIKKNHE